jgi:hypothetical protein
MLYRFIIIVMLAMPTLAHSDNGNYGSDIPESLMWLLSFFLLIGFLFVVGSYFMVPDPVTECDRERVTYLRILPEDLDRLAKRLNDHKNNDQTKESSV